MPLPLLDGDQTAFIAAYITQCSVRGGAALETTFTTPRWEAASFMMAVGLQQRLADALSESLTAPAFNERRRKSNGGRLHRAFRGPLEEVLDPEMSMLLELLSIPAIATLAMLAPEPAKFWAHAELDRRRVCLVCTDVELGAAVQSGKDHIFVPRGVKIQIAGKGLLVLTSNTMISGGGLISSGGKDYIALRAQDNAVVILDGITIVGEVVVSDCLSWEKNEVRVGADRPGHIRAFNTTFLGGIHADGVGCTLELDGVTVRPDNRRGGNIVYGINVCEGATAIVRGGSVGPGFSSRAVYTEGHDDGGTVMLEGVEVSGSIRAYPPARVLRDGREVGMPAADDY